jgi:hypothetical protein
MASFVGQGIKPAHIALQQGHWRNAACSARRAFEDGVAVC